MLIEIKNWKRAKKYYHNNRENINDLEKTRRDIQKNEINELKKTSDFNAGFGNVKIYFFSCLIMPDFQSYEYLIRLYL